MDEKDHLALSIENALREADGLAGLFGDYTRQINALLPLFDSHAHGQAEKIRAMNEGCGQKDCLACEHRSEAADLIDPKIKEGFQE